MLSVLAALSWNPTIRGLLFPGIMVVILCGSTYLIVATNVGNRLGFLVSAAALSGWMMLMAIIWLIYGIGMQGNAAHWKVEEYLVGSTEKAQYEPAANLSARNGWNILPEGNAVRGDAQAAVDALMIQEKLFTSANDYVTLTDAYQRGGEKHLLDALKGDACDWEFVKRLCINHKANRVVIQLQAARKTTTTQLRAGERVEVETIARNADGTIARDTSQPVISVVMIRDLGSKRQPAFVLFVTSAILFAVCAATLHSRDKKVMALQAAA